MAIRFGLAVLFIWLLTAASFNAVLANDAASDDSANSARGNPVPSALDTSRIDRPPEAEGKINEPASSAPNGSDQKQFLVSPQTSSKAAADSGVSGSVPQGARTSPDGKAPFALGVRKSVIDTGAESENVDPQKGAIDNNRFPPLKSGAGNAGAKIGGNVNAGDTIKLGAEKSALTQVQLQKLANHDLVLIIDQSGSMRTPDCPYSGVGRAAGTIMNILLGPAASISRWDWCRDQAMKLAHETRYVSSKGLTVILFSNRYAIFQNVTLNQIPMIFSQNSPYGGTNLTEPLRVTIADYFNRRDRTRGNVKPLAISIVTDGIPDNEGSVREALIEATRFMRSPNEITVTFFLIGNNAYDGQAFVSDLDRNLMREGARYNIVRSVSFWNLEKLGLPKALADALDE